MGNIFGPRGTKDNWYNFWKNIFYRAQYYRKKYCKNLRKRGCFLTKHTLIAQYYSKKYCKALRKRGCFLKKHNIRNMNQLRTILKLRNRNSSTEQVLISGYINGWHQYFHKQKAQILQLNSSVQFKSRRILKHIGWRLVCPFFWHRSPGEKLGVKWSG